MESQTRDSSAGGSIEESSAIPLENSESRERKRWYVLPATNGSNSSQQGEPLKPIHHYLYTLILFYLSFGIGVLEGGFSTALVDLRFYLKTDINHVALYFTFYSMGSSAGGSMGFLFKYKFFNRQITMAIISITCGISFALIPHSPSLYVYYTLALLCGIYCGLVYCIASVWLMEIWKEKCHPILHVNYFLEGIGFITGPIIFSYFLIGEQIQTQNQATSSNRTLFEEDNYLDQKSERKLSLTWPFLIVGTIIFLSGLFNWIMIFYRKYQHQEKDVKKEDKDEVGNASCSSSSLKLFNTPGAPKKFVIFLAALSLTSIWLTSGTFRQFSPTFSQFIPLNLSASQAASVISIFYAFLIIGRLIAVYVAIKSNEIVMLVGNLFLSILAHLILLVSTNSYVLLVIGNVLFGLGFCSYTATFYSFLGSYLVYTDRISTVIQVSGGLIRVIYPAIMGRYIKSYPMSMIYYNFVTLFISVFCFVSLMITIRIYKKRLAANH